MKDTDEDTAQEAEALSAVNNNYTTKDAIHKVFERRASQPGMGPRAKQLNQNPKATGQIQNTEIQAKCICIYIRQLQATKGWKSQRYSKGKSINW